MNDTSWVDCPACGSTLSKPVRSSGDRIGCGRCGSIRFAKRPNADDLSAAYKAAWSAGQSHAVGATDAAIAAQLVSLAPGEVTDRVVLDWGAGKGSVAIAARRRGAVTRAYEPFGPPVAIDGVEWISEQSELSGEHDVVFMVEVIEHSLDPLGDLREVHSHLRYGGAVIVTTPNRNGLNARLASGKWRELLNPVHVVLFSPRGLEQIAERAGFASSKRLTSWVDFGHGGLRHPLSKVLTATRLDGSLRYLLVKHSRG